MRARESKKALRRDIAALRGEVGKLRRERDDARTAYVESLNRLNKEIDHCEDRTKKVREAVAILQALLPKWTITPTSVSVTEATEFTTTNGPAS